MLCRIVVNRTWLKETNSQSYGIKGYNHIAKTRTKKLGGGVSIFLDELIPFKLREDLMTNNDDMESIWIEIDRSYVHTDRNLIIGAIYRPPGNCPDNFNEHLTNSLSTISSERKKCWHCGDYNLDMLNTDNHKSTKDFVESNFAHSEDRQLKEPVRQDG